MTTLRPDAEVSRRSLPREVLVDAPREARISSIQPGGGVCMRLELLWGGLRRWYLKRFRPGYVRRMAELRRGDPQGCPHEVLDPRDLKFYRNVCDCSWAEEDDPFRWRARLPLARDGMAELLLLGLASLVLTAWLAWQYVWACWVPAGLGLFFVWFFRSPRRAIPGGPGLVVSPADGKVVSVERLEQVEQLGGPAVLVGIFLSIFDVHVNRAPLACRVTDLSYRPGKFLNALRPESARENEQMAIQLQETAPPHRRLVVRQIAGAIARRIVCGLRPGQELERGEPFGMIKLGSRTELVLPWEAGLELAVAVGDRVRGGSTVIARYPANSSADGGTVPENRRV
jgi:phosphatidylserine decarboxylase